VYKGFTILLIFLAILLAIPIRVTRAEGDSSNPAVNVAAEAQAIRDLLQQAMRAYRLGDYPTAFKWSRAAYLDHFENIEIPLRTIDGNLTLDLEYRFANLRSKMQQGAPASEVEKAAQSVREGVDEVDAMFTNAGVLVPTLALVSGFSVIFREGVEAVLVLAALLGYLRASQSQSLGRYIFYGVGLAVLASVLSWLLVHYLIRITPLAREVSEAVISFLAVGVLFWVNFWLIRRLDQKRWMEFMRARAWSAMASGSSVGLIILGFTAVYREGLETALFYEVLTLMSTRMELYLLLGFGAGVVALGATTWVILKTSRRLPIHRFFQITVTLLMILSVTFIGSAVNSLQESGFIGTTLLVGSVPRLPYLLATLTGFHPAVETIAAQAFMVGLYVMGWAVMQVQRRKATQSAKSQQVASA